MKTKIKQNLKGIGIKVIALIMLVIMLSMFPIQSLAFENFFEKIITNPDGEEDPGGEENPGYFRPLYLTDFKDSAYRGDFFYKGVPEGHMIGGNVNIFKWIVNFLYEIADYLLGLIASVFNMGVLGWGILIEVLLSEAFDSLTVRNVGSGTYRKNNSGFYTDSKRTVNIENIIFNRVEALNVNFFESKESVRERLLKYSPTGLEMEELYGDDYPDDFEVDDGPLLVIKDYFAFIFLILYGVALLLLLIALIINAIMATIESVAAKKATYKQRAISWGKAFIEMLLLIVYMMAILQLHTTVINILSNFADSAADTVGGTAIQTDMGRNYTILETLRTRAYSLKLTVGVPATIMYLVLIWYTFKFILMYLKRFLVVFFLSLLGPLLMIYDLIMKTIKGKSSVRTDWIKEYTFNILIQVVHAFVYLIFIPIIYALATKSIIGFIIMFILLKFLLEADKIIRQIFSIRGSKRHSTLDNVLEKSTLKDYGAGLVVGSLLGNDGLGGTIKKNASKILKPITATAGAIGGEAFRGGYNLSQYAREKIKDKRGPAGIEAERKRQEKKDKAVEEVLKKQGYSDDEIDQRMNPDNASYSSLGLTDEQKDRKRLLDSSKVAKTNMIIRGIRKAEYTSSRFKRVLKNMGEVDEKGRRRIKGREYSFDFEEKKIKVSDGVHDKFKKAVIKEFDMGKDDKGQEEYRKTIEDFKRAGNIGLKTATGILFFPISFADPSVSKGLSLGLLGNFQFNSKAFQTQKGKPYVVQGKVTNSKLDIKTKKNKKNNKNNKNNKNKKNTVKKIRKTNKKTNKNNK